MHIVVLFNQQNKTQKDIKMKLRLLHTIFMTSLLMCCFAYTARAQEIAFNKSELNYEIYAGSTTAVTIQDLKVDPAVKGTWTISLLNQSGTSVGFDEGKQPYINRYSGVITFTPSAKQTVAGQSSVYEIVFTPSDATITPIACRLKLNVKSDVVTTVLSKPAPENVVLGQELEFAKGTVLKMIYASGKPSAQVDLSKCTISGYDKNAKGENAVGVKKITVSYENYTPIAFDVTVEDKVVNLGLTSDKNTYYVTEQFDPSTCYVLPIMQSEREAERVSADSADVTVDLSGFSTAAQGRTFVTISYGGCRVKKAFEVAKHLFPKN